MLNLKNSVIENGIKKRKCSKNIKLLNTISSPILRFQYRKLQRNKLKRLSNVSSSKRNNQLFKTKNVFEIEKKYVEESFVDDEKKRSRNKRIEFPKYETHMECEIGINVRTEHTRPTVKNASKEIKSIDVIDKPSIVKMPTISNVDKVFDLETNVINDNDTYSSLNCLMSTVDKAISNVDKNKCIINIESRFNISNNLDPSNKKEKPNNVKNKNKTRSISDGRCFTIKSSDMEISTVYELIGSKFLVVMKPECCLYLIGIMELELLKGCIDVLGYRVTKQKQKMMIFSLKGSSIIFLKAITSNEAFPQQPSEYTTEKLNSLGLPEKKINKILKEAETSTLFIISRNKSHVSSSVWPVFFENHLSCSLFPSNDLINHESRPWDYVEHRMDCILEGDTKNLCLKCFNEAPDWLKINDVITCEDFPKAVLCGGKSVGKSTFLRYLVNKCLHKWKHVVVLDFDPGQCEFTVAGCISLVLIQEPLLGPNFTHLKIPLKSVYLGEVDVTKCPESYIEGCKYLVDCAKENHRDIPWLVNTMGFTRGIGVTLNCGIIQTVGPSHVVQIESKDRKLNYPSELHPGFVFSQSANRFGSAGACLDYTLHVINSASELSENTPQKSRGISPAEARNLAILSYFSGMLSSDILNLSQVVPYTIQMDQIELQTIKKYNLTKSELAATMNGNMVALCSSGESDPFPNCLGFGIVRGIDWNTSTIFLITPLPLHMLSTVNCLIKGNVALPESVLYNQGNLVAGAMPYIALTSGKPTSRFAKRDFRSLPVTPREVGGSDKLY